VIAAGMKTAPQFITDEQYVSVAGLPDTTWLHLVRNERPSEQ
jgi:hypothetical protein